MECKVCPGSLTAEIKEIKVEGVKTYRPVWYCKDCDLSFIAHKNTAHEWVDKFEWEPSLFGVDYGDTCLGCMVEGLMYADVENILGGEVFPFYVRIVPSWTCYRCGYSSPVVYRDKYSWADKYHLWGS